MHLECLQISDFRIYTAASLSCTPGMNLLVGHNGAGKTTLLEAICVGAWGRALDAPDAVLVRQGASQYWVRLEARSDHAVPYWVEVTYSPTTGKQIRSAHGASLRPGELIGVIPVVFLSAATKEITMGAPQERRRFLDLTLSQSSRLYTELLLQHRRVLRQRNILLQHQHATPDFWLQWKSWTAHFIQLSAELVWRRWHFLREFEPLAQAYYRRIAPEELQLRYLPDSLPEECLEEGVEAIASCFRQRAELLHAEELRRGQTLFGPQKDELLFLLNGLNARETASHGQHKSIALSLGLAQLEYIRHKRSETPILLLDDIFAELDERRTADTLAVLEEQAVQTFITLTEPHRVPAHARHRFHWVRVDAGTLLPLSPQEAPSES